jgi:CRP/FNR family transcriptional regulator, cyclic AMP receptor protein
MNFSEFLLSVPQFANFTQPELEVLEKAMIVRDYADGHVFMKEGERGDAMYLIIEGEVVVSRKHKLERGVDVLEKMGRGDMFGLISLVDNGRRSATCTAVGKTAVASLPYSAFRLLFRANAPIAHHFQYLIARQLAHDARIYNQGLHEALMAGDESRMYAALERVSSHEYRGRERRERERKLIGAEHDAGDTS